VGGNTSCVEVRCKQTLLVLDAGTGLRRLGDWLTTRGDTVRAHLLFSHVHWDHIQGLPFFGPIYRPETQLTLYGAPEGGSLREILESQMQSPTFPVSLAQAPAAIAYHTIEPRGPLAIGSLQVTAAPLRHPNGVLAFRVECEGRSVVYATDTEHDPNGAIDDTLVELARRADLLIYDAQYTPEEYDGTVGFPRRGWGHSTWAEGVRVARAADVGRLILFHHEPSHDDAQVAAIEQAAARELPGTVAAREGMSIALASDAKRAGREAA
jgi:phosphoribosyl 1,2-cyclic phosphodiesterase